MHPNVNITALHILHTIVFGKNKFDNSLKIFCGLEIGSDYNKKIVSLCDSAN